MINAFDGKGVLEKKKYTIWDTILLPFKFCPVIAAAIAVLALIIGLVPTFQTLAVARFIDMAKKLALGQAEYINVLFWISVIIVFIAISWISKNIKTLFAAKLELELRKTFRVYITVKRSRLKYYYIEDSNTWDLISRISEKPETRLKDVYINFFDFIALIVQIFGLISIFVSQVWQLAVILVVFCIPLLVISLKGGKVSYRARLETQKYHRRHEYLANILTGRDEAQERVLFNYGKSVCNMWHEYYEKARKKELVTEFKWFIRSRIGSIITVFVSILVTIFLIKPVLTKAITTGMFMSLVNSTYSLVDTMTWSFAGYIEQIANNVEYMKEFTKFVYLDDFEGEQAEKKEPVLFESIEFRDVKFKYPGTEKYILNGFSYKFVKNQHYALIGINGAGKTTLVKIMTGLYDEYEGQILLNGKELKEYSFSDISRLFTIIYQDYARYSLSIRDNILVGNMEEFESVPEKKLSQIVKDVGLSKKLKQYGDGLDTKLGKIYENGQDISGGQWQRIALARTIISNAPVCILDEPTSALDPISESNLYQDFHNITNGKTVIFISHRLGSTKLADRILVLSGGKVIEDGTHHQLMDRNGVYSNIYNSQRSWYGETGS